MIPGLLLEVRADDRSTAATAAAAVGATAVQVDDVTPFDSDGGQVDIAGVVYDYTGVDETNVTADGDGGTLLLAAPLTVAVEEFDPISVLVGTDVAVDYYAVIDLGSDDEDGHPIDVPLETREERLAWPVRVYDPPLPVSLSDDLEQIVAAPGAVPQIDAGVVDPATVTSDVAGTWGVVVQAQLDAEAARVDADIAALDTAHTAAEHTIDLRVDDIVNNELPQRPPHIESTGVPGATANVAGTIWEQYNTLTPAAGQSRKLLAAWRGTGGTSWVSVSLDPVYIPQIDVNAGTFGLLLAKRLLVTDFTDYVRDPSFEGIGTWSGVPSASGSMTYGNYSPRPGDRTGQFLVFTTSAIAEGGNAATLEDPFAVQPGDQFHCSMIARRASSTVQTAGYLALRFYFYDKNMQIMPGVGYYREASIAMSAMTDTSWWDGHDAAHPLLTLDVTIPDGVAFARVYPLVFSTTQAGAGIYNVDEVHCRRRNGGELIVDGAVQARHFNGDSFTGVTMTAPLFRTTETADRGIKIVSSDNGGYGSLAAWDSTGVPTFVLNGQTGSVVMKGDLTSGSTVSGATVTGGVVQTGTTGTRMLMKDDGLGGVLQGWTGDPAEDFPGSVNPGIVGSGGTRVAVTDLWSPKLSTTNGFDRAHVQLASRSANGANPPQVIFDAVIVANRGINSSGDVNATDHYSTNQTGAAAGDAEFGPGGGIRRKVSARKYKTNIGDLGYDPETLLQLEPHSFLRLDPEVPGWVPDVGVIADEADELGLEAWVERGLDGEIEGFRYSTWTAALQAIVRHQAKQIADLTAESTELRDMVTALADRVAALEVR